MTLELSIFIGLRIQASLVVKKQDLSYKFMVYFSAKEESVLCDRYTTHTTMNETRNKNFFIGSDGIDMGQAVP